MRDSTVTSNTMHIEEERVFDETKGLAKRQRHTGLLGKSARLAWKTCSHITAVLRSFLSLKGVSMSLSAHLRLMLVLLMASAIGLVGCGTAPQPTSTPTESSVTSRPEANATWENILAAAKQEGEVIVWSGSVGPDATAFLKDAFERAYPEIKVTLFQARSSERDSRFMQEFEAGSAKVDILNGGPSGANARLKTTGKLQDLRPFLLLPEVKEPKHWTNDQLTWIDAEQQYILQSEGVYFPALAVHESVDPASLQNWNDLLDPRWKGKIVMTDPRQSGAAIAGATFLYHTPELGPAFTKRFYSESEVIFAEDERAAADMVAKGTALIWFSPNPSQVEELQKLGMKVGYIPQLKLNGQSAGWSGGNTGLLFVPNLNPLPHPNAAVVYINWFYSQAGQQAFVDIMKQPSARKDVDLSKIPAYLLPTPGGHYLNAAQYLDEVRLKATRDDVTAWRGEPQRN